VNSQVWWYVARSSGIVAWALLSASVVWGLLLSTKISTTRLAARRLRPAWLLDLHRHLGGLAVIFTAIHIIGIVADSYVTFSWADVFVPMASQWRPGAVAFGVVAMYLLVAVEATSLAIRHLPRPLWRWMHRSSFVLYATATWHGISAGTDAGNQWFRAAAWTSVVLVVALTVRLVLVLRSRSSRSEPARVRAVVPPPPLPPPPPPTVSTPTIAPEAPVPLFAAIPPLPGSVAEMTAPTIPVMPDTPPRPVEPPTPAESPTPTASAPPVGVLAAPDLVGVSPGASDAGGLEPPRAGS
jgi:methionine sulfoxide reductase heme-binding subunit